MKRLNRTNIEINKSLPIKVVQFGEGNFLRAFVDYAFHTLNKECNTDIGVAVVQPIEQGLVKMLADQDGLYTLFSKGYKDGQTKEEKHLVSSIVKTVDPYLDYHSYLHLAHLETLEFIISNTTEAGIAYNENDKINDNPPSSYPAKLTALLFERFKHFNGSSTSALTIIPCELINYNSDKLKEAILQYADLWNLGNEFKYWIVEYNSFHNTLVDRIVPGYPKNDLATYQSQLDYDDKLIVTSELFFLWVIEGGDKLKKQLPFSNTSLDVKIVGDMQPYRTRKVRILNGAHTSMVPICILHDRDTVQESIEHPFTGEFVKHTIYKEIIPTLDLDKSELEQFANDVLDRFRNPYIKHQLKSIALNSISKFKVRVLPSLLKYIKLKNQLPQHLTFAFACLIRFYKGTWQGQNTPLNDDQAVVDFFNNAWSLDSIDKTITTILSHIDFWDQDLTEVPNLQEALNIALTEIDNNGIEEGYNNYKSRI